MNKIKAFCEDFMTFWYRVGLDTSWPYIMALPSICVLMILAGFLPPILTFILFFSWIGFYLYIFLKGFSAKAIAIIVGISALIAILAG